VGLTTTNELAINEESWIT